MSTASGRPESERRVFSVSDLLAGLVNLLEDQVGRVWVSGEISNLHRARSGHAYFTLKDAEGQIRCALFRSAASRVPFELEEGLEVQAYAEVGVYQQRGDLQLIVRTLEPLGQGALQLAFEQLRHRLEAEGLFDPAIKSEPPTLPRRIGVVTSPTSAAVRDVIEVTGRRLPGVPILISPTQVQGQAAADEVAAAIDAIARQDVDVVLVVRGGGSLEDLWAFNTEVVARAIARCPVPVISGVGHEVDVTICDLVADLRAPTPSAAAEHALPHRDALRSQLETTWRALGSAVTRYRDSQRSRVARERDALRALSPATRLATQRQRLRAAVRGLPQAFGRHPERARARLEIASRALPTAYGRYPERARGRLGVATRGLEVVIHHCPERAQARLGALAARLDALSPLAVLGRGFAVVRRTSDGRILRRSDEVSPGERVRVQLAEGTLLAQVEDEEAP